MPIMPTKARPYVAQLHLLHTAAGTAAQLPHWQPVPVPDGSFREGSLTSTLTCSPSLVLSLVTRGQPPHHTQLSAAESNSSEETTPLPSRLPSPLALQCLHRRRRPPCTGPQSGPTLELSPAQCSPPCPASSTIPDRSQGAAGLLSPLGTTLARLTPALSTCPRSLSLPSSHSAPRRSLQALLGLLGRSTPAC